MKTVYTGLESSGKSLLLASTFLRLAKRNFYWRQKYGFTRKIMSNLRFSDDVLQEYSDFIVYYDDIRDIVGKTGCDIIIDEVSSYFSALKRDPLSRKINRWLRQGAKQGVHLYCTAQEYHDIHLDLRRRFTFAYKVNKILGSRRGGDNLPPVKFIWGIIAIRELKIHPYNEIEPDYISIIPNFLWIGKKLCGIFNTHQVIEVDDNFILEHRDYICENSDCKFTKTTHS